MPSTAKQAGSFALVGILNTVLDFAIFNSVHSFGHVTPFVANLISTSVTMLISFQINRKYVFSGSKKHAGHQAAMFLLVTAVGLYVLQGGIIYLITSKILHSTGFLAANFAKLVGTVASLIWNFFLYKRVVFT